MKRSLSDNLFLNSPSFLFMGGFLFFKMSFIEGVDLDQLHFFLTSSDNLSEQQPMAHRAFGSI
jgi:hypothetical protein